MGCSNRVNACTQTNVRRVLCVGMCVLEVVHTVEKFPVEDCKTHSEGGTWQRSGSASNICTVLRELGSKAEFMGVLSSAPAFLFLQTDCIRRSIGIDHCPVVEQDPPFQSVIIDKETNTRTTFHGNANFPPLTNDKFCSLNLTQFAWVHFEGINPDETIRMMQAIRTHNSWTCDKIMVSVELKQPGIPNVALGDMADVIFLNKDYAKSLDWNEPRDAIYALRNCLRAPPDRRKPTIICPWGDKGAFCLDSKDNYENLPVLPAEKIVSGLGAGDTFIAATIFALISLRLNLKNSIKFGNYCAGYKLSLNGFDGLAEFIRCNCKGCKTHNPDNEPSCGKC